MPINYSLSIDNGNKIIIKKANNKKEFLRLVMLYVGGSYAQKLDTFNALVNKAEALVNNSENKEEKPLSKSKNKKNE